MKHKLFEIWHGKVALDRILKQKLPAPVSYKLFLLKESMMPTIKWIQERHNEIVVKYGTEINGKIGISSDDYENMAKYNDELESILSEDSTHEVNKIKLQLDEETKIEGNDIGLLRPFIEFIL